MDVQRLNAVRRTQPIIIGKNVFNYPSPPRLLHGIQPQHFNVNIHRKDCQCLLSLRVLILCVELTVLLLLQRQVVLADDVVNLLDVLAREDVAAALLAHAAVVRGLGEAEVVVGHRGRRCSLTSS